MSKAKTNMIIKRIVNAAMTVLLMLSFWAFIGTQTALICRNAVHKAGTKKNLLVPAAAILASVIIGIVLILLFPAAE